MQLFLFDVCNPCMHVNAVVLRLTYVCNQQACRQWLAKPRALDKGMPHGCCVLVAMACSPPVVCRCDMSVATVTLWLNHAHVSTAVYQQLRVWDACGCSWADG